jgi:hypothetical protein
MFGLKTNVIEMIVEAIKRFPEITEAVIFGSRADDTHENIDAQALVVIAREADAEMEDLESVTFLLDGACLECGDLLWSGTLGVTVNRGADARLLGGTISKHRTEFGDTYTVHLSPIVFVPDDPAPPPLLIGPVVQAPAPVVNEPTAAPTQFVVAGRPQRGHWNPFRETIQHLTDEDEEDVENLLPFAGTLLADAQTLQQDQA